MYQTVKVAETSAISPQYRRIVIQSPEMAQASQPGQFMMLKAWEGTVPFLMRPISINDADPAAGTVSFLYKVVGEGTALMAKLQKGDSLQALGPFGHGFPLAAGAKRIAVIGRGIGIAPLRLLARRAVEQGTEVYAYLSAKEEEQLFDRRELEDLGVILRTTCDARVNVTAFFGEDLEKLAFDAAYSCGSKRLMGEMHQLHLRHGFESYVSLEEHMACGIGACKGCVCRTRGEDGGERYETVCQCGPVFPTERIV